MLDPSFIAGLDLLAGLGILGGLCFLGAHAALLSGRMMGRSYRFAALNLVAALLLAPALIVAFGAGAAALLALWALVSLAGILRLRHLRARMAIGRDEEPLVEALVPGLPSDRARILLSLGRWQELRPGTALTKEGEPVRWLSYLAQGYCQVERDGERIATLGPGSLVGEVTFLSGEPASATVRTVGKTRIFAFEGKQLRRVLAEEDDIRIALEHSILTVVGGRLRRTTDDIARLKRVFEQAGLARRKSPAGGGRR